MNILGLSDEKNAETEGAMRALGSWAKQGGHEASFVCASELSIGPCLGCFGCWLKTPGSCVIPGDDGRSFAEKLGQTDLLVMMTKIPFGSYAPSIKRALDRSISILLPYFSVHNGEMHHVQRYRRARRLLHVPYGEYGEEELATFGGLALAHCDNFRSPHPTRRFAYRGDPEALVAWVAEEVGA
jgi:Multimeric flavodoxin WrbA